MRDALSLLDQVISACGPGARRRRRWPRRWGPSTGRWCRPSPTALIRRDARQLLETVEEVFDRGVDLRRLAEELALELRHVLVTRATGAAAGGAGRVRADGGGGAGAAGGPGAAGPALRRRARRGVGRRTGRPAAAGAGDGAAQGGPARPHRLHPRAAGAGGAAPRSRAGEGRPRRAFTRGAPVVAPGRPEHAPWPRREAVAPREHARPRARGAPDFGGVDGLPGASVTASADGDSANSDSASRSRCRGHRCTPRRSGSELRGAPAAAPVRVVAVPTPAAAAPAPRPGLPLGPGRRGARPVRRRRVSTDARAIAPLPIDTSPGGCATGECLPEVAPARTGRDDATRPLARALARGAGHRGRGVRPARRIAEAGPAPLPSRGRGGAGLSPDAGFHRTTVTGQSGRQVVERLLSLHFARPTRLVVDDRAAPGGEEPGRARRRGTRRARATPPDSRCAATRPSWPPCASWAASWSTSRSWNGSGSGAPGSDVVDEQP